ncbi:MAG: hypothetical protein PHE47_08565 [Oscillospiraceae bacterium]|nr:hypothetical protein [Oscillospiraceae bacterium]
MKKRLLALVISILACFLWLTGCTSTPAQNSQSLSDDSKLDAIPFEENQLYAVAYLGYQETTDLDFYVEHYLEDSLLPTHYLSGGEYYLIIPRYAGMSLALYQNDIETMEPVLVYEDPDCKPFILQCNASDIFADATIQLTYRDQTVAFSPFLSLKDGTLDVGANGLELSKEETQSSLK